MVICAGALGCAGVLTIFFPKSIWFLALCSHYGPKYLYLAMKTSYLHVYLVPTPLLIFRKNFHLYVYLVYKFIQYHGVLFLNTIFDDCNVTIQPSNTFAPILVLYNFSNCYIVNWPFSEAFNNHISWNFLFTHLIYS